MTKVCFILLTCLSPEKHQCAFNVYDVTSIGKNGWLKMEVCKRKGACRDIGESTEEVVNKIKGCK